MGTRPPRAGFDGYTGHIGIDPDTEIITATTLTPGNAGADRGWINPASGGRLWHGSGW